MIFSIAMQTKEAGEKGYIKRVISNDVRPFAVSTVEKRYKKEKRYYA